MKKQQGFSFTFETYQTGTLIKIFVSMVLFCGLYACFWSALALSNTNVPPYLPATAGLFYCAAACKLPKKAGAFQAAAMVILLVYIGFAGRYIIDGWNVVMNSVFQLLERRLGNIFPRYELTQAVTPDFCAMLFLVLPAILLGMLSARAVCGTRWWRAGIILLCLLLSAAILLSIYPPDWCCLLLALGLMFSCLQHTICFNTNPTRFRTVAAFSMYNSAYIEGIHNLYEFDCGELSGWMYKVNEWFPNYGCSRYQLRDGDVICWEYTCDLGVDVGGYRATGG